MTSEQYRQPIIDVLGMSEFEMKRIETHPDPEGELRRFLQDWKAQTHDATENDFIAKNDDYIDDVVDWEY